MAGTLDPYMQQIMAQQAGMGIPGMVGGMQGQPTPPGQPPFAMPPPGQQNAPGPTGAAPQPVPVQPQGMTQDQMMMEYLTSMGKLQPEQREIARKRAMVDQLRQGGGRMPGMRTGGRVETAAHPLEFLSSLAHQGVGAYKEDQANEQQTGFDAKSETAFEDLKRQARRSRGEPEPFVGPV